LFDFVISRKFSKPVGASIFIINFNLISELDFLFDRSSNISF
jgi:hypothetical protein